jgi:hypothetical protein
LNIVVVAYFGHSGLIDCVKGKGFAGFIWQSVQTRASKEIARPLRGVDGVEG